MLSSLLMFAGVGPFGCVTIGLGFGYAFAISRLVRGERAERQERDAAAALHAQDFACGIAEAVTVEHIVDVLAVADLEDLGPGYVVRAADAEVVYLASESLLPSKDDEENAVTPRETLEAIRRPYSKELVDVRWSGAEVPTVGWIGVTELPVELYVQCEVLPEAPWDWLLERCPLGRSS